MADEAASRSGVPGAMAGYAPDFLSARIAPPELGTGIEHDAFLWDGTEAIPYTHFSLSLSKSRRFARWVAWNIDGASIQRLSRTGLDFRTDPRIPASAQVGNELYAGNRLDRGHLARRADLLWGDPHEAGQANRDSFYYTNIAPQMDDFNQSSQDGVWGRLENALFDGVDVDDLRVSVFAGPVFHDDDRLYRGVPLPREFWKLLAFEDNGTLKTHAFLLTQHLDQLKAVLHLDEFRVYEITVAELEDRTCLRFPAQLHAGDTTTPLESLAFDKREPLATTADIRW
ncbi:DNA/RNA non-specific endonuclease [Arthrobacter oryzae]|nr:DNA/RNA non-specific endonuclease [Arthrobacter oryzae]